MKALTEITAIYLAKIEKSEAHDDLDILHVEMYLDLDAHRRYNTIHDIEIAKDKIITAIENKRKTLTAKT